MKNIVYFEGFYFVIIFYIENIISTFIINPFSLICKYRFVAFQFKDLFLFELCIKIR